MFFKDKIYFEEDVIFNVYLVSRISKDWIYNTLPVFAIYLGLKSVFWADEGVKISLKVGHFGLNQIQITFKKFVWAALSEN